MWFSSVLFHSDIFYTSLYSIWSKPHIVILLNGPESCFRLQVNTMNCSQLAGEKPVWGFFEPQSCIRSYLPDIWHSLTKHQIIYVHCKALVLYIWDKYNNKYMTDSHSISSEKTSAVRLCSMFAVMLLELLFFSIGYWHFGQGNGTTTRFVCCHFPQLIAVLCVCDI